MAYNDDTKDKKNGEENGSMSVQEAGRMGGEKRREELGPEGYSKLGREGGKHSHDNDSIRDEI